MYLFMIRKRKFKTVSIECKENEHMYKVSVPFCKSSSAEEFLNILLCEFDDFCDKLQHNITQEEKPRALEFYIIHGEVKPNTIFLT